MDIPERVELRIVFHCDSTLPDEKVVLVGSINELGNWNPRDGVSLLTDPTCFPQWTATIFIPTMTTFEYKYVVVGSGTLDVRRWESLPNNGNRKMTVKSKGTFAAFETEGSLDTAINKLRLSKQLTDKIKGRLGAFRAKDKRHKEVRIDPISKANSQNLKKGEHHKYLEEDIPLASQSSAVEKEIGAIKRSKKPSDDDLQGINAQLQNVNRKKKLGSYNLLTSPTNYHQHKLLETPDSSSEEGGIRRGASVIRNIKDLEQRILSCQDLTHLAKAEESDESENKPINYYQPQREIFEDIREHEDEPEEFSSSNWKMNGVDFDITEKEAILIVCIKLPFWHSYDKNGKIILTKTTSLLYSKLYKCNPESNVQEWWIGWVGCFPKTEEEKQKLIAAYREVNCIPVIIDEEYIDEYYNFYEKQVIPLFHNFKTHFEHKESYDQFDDWDCYKLVNQLFADCISDFIRDEVEPQGKNALVWLNNQHLLLTPRYLREKGQNMSIGLFLHCPFPASEIFKLIPYRKNLLKSLLSCDCIGFHSFEYARNFFTTCKRVLGVNFEFRRTGQLGIDYHGRNVSLVISHVGVSYDSIFKQVNAPKFRRIIKSGKKNKRMIFASIDTLSQIAGLKEKFLAYQSFLRADPSHAKTCRLIQYLEPVSYGKQYTADTYQDIVMKIKDEIVEEFGHHVISVKTEALSENKRLMLWARTNCLFNTTLRGGLRLPSLEYISVR